MKFACLASGSSGNSQFVATENTKILVDVGVSCRKIENGLMELGSTPREIEGILITHEHTDHIQGLGTFTKKYQVPIYGTIETLSAIKRSNVGRNIPVELLMNVEGDAEFAIGDLGVNVSEISHDAAHAVCYRVTDGSSTVAMATDLGTYDENLVNHLSEADLLYLETNYDPDMLMVGPYPYLLKQRINGERGHLSNDQSAELATRVLHPGLKHIVLAHLSKENNYPEIAEQTFINMLNENWDFKTNKPTVEAAKRDCVSAIWEL